MKKILSLVLALSLCLCMGVTAFAAEVNTNGGTGSTPVSLSSTSDGTIGGDPAATAMSVTVPTAFPMAMAQNGDVTRMISKSSVHPMKKPSEHIKPQNYG